MSEQKINVWIRPPALSHSDSIFHELHETEHLENMADWAELHISHRSYVPFSRNLWRIHLVQEHFTTQANRLHKNLTQKRKAVAGVANSPLRMKRILLEIWFQSCESECFKSSNQISGHFLIYRHGTKSGIFVSCFWIRLLTPFKTPHWGIEDIKHKKYISIHYNTLDDRVVNT